MGVSKNSGTPNHPFNRVFHYKPSILGETPLFLEIPKWTKKLPFFTWRWLAAIVTCYRWPKRIPLESSDGLELGLVDFGWANFWSPATVVCQNMEGKDLTNILSLKNWEVSGG